MYWDDSTQGILHIDIQGAWTWHDYDEINTVAIAMMASVDYRVDVIAELTQAGSVPKNSLDSAQRVKRMREMRPLNYGMTVNVGTDVIARATFTAGSLISNQRIQQAHFADSVREALQMILDNRHLYGEYQTP